MGLMIENNIENHLMPRKILQSICMISLENSNGEKKY